MEAFAKRYFRVKDKKKANRTIDKFMFVCTVTLMVFMAVCVASAELRALTPYIFCISSPLLIGTRWWQYKKTMAHYFLLDWCYWINLLCVIYLLALPDKGILFGFLFVAAHGPLAWTVLVYRNSLVFHSIDKFTSFFIHVAPPATFYALRWYPEDCSRLWYTDFVTSVEDDAVEVFDLDSEPSSLTFALGMSLLVVAAYAFQQGVQILFLNYFVKRPCMRKCFHFDPEKHMTLFSYSANTGSGLVYKLIHACGPKHRLTMWYLTNVLYTCINVIPTYLLYKYQIANVSFLVFVFIVGVYNGSTFYIEVFSIKYAFRRSIRRPAREVEDEVIAPTPNSVGSSVDPEAQISHPADDVTASDDEYDNDESEDVESVGNANNGAEK